MPSSISLSPQALLSHSGDRSGQLQEPSGNVCSVVTKPGSKTSIFLNAYIECVWRLLLPKITGPGTVASPTRTPNNPIFQDT